MNNDLSEIIKMLEINHPAAVELRENALKLCSTRKGAQELIKQLEKESEVGECNYQGYFALCTLFKAWARAILNKSDSLLESHNALKEFRTCGNDFNEALINWFLGIIYQNHGHEQQAISAFEEACKLLTYRMDLSESESDFEKASTCRKSINEIKAGYETRSVPITPNPVNACLVYGVYDMACASSSGRFVFDDIQISELSIDQISFDEVPHIIFNLRPGKQVVLGTQSDYRWLRVTGNSMNQAKPVAIQDKDYILVDLNQVPQIGNIVVARLRNPPTPEERAGVVKRYSRGGLSSESSEEITDISMNEVEIRGVVMAVAKPA